MMPADDWFGDTMDWKQVAAAFPTFVQWAVQTHGPLPDGEVKKEDFDRLSNEYSRLYGDEAPAIVDEIEPVKMVALEAQPIHLWGYVHNLDRWVFGTWMPGSDTPIDVQMWVDGAMARQMPYDQRPEHMRDMPRRAFAPDTWSGTWPEITRWKKRARDMEGYLTSLTDGVLSNAPDNWTGGSQSTQEIALAYVRWLEQKVMEAYGSLNVD